MKPSSQATQSGNILFIIMLGIALFAALSLAVTQSGKNIGGAEREKVNLMATEIVDYGASMAAGMQKMLITGSCDETDVSFETAALTGYEHTPVAPDRCKLFSPLGGRLNYTAPDTRWFDTTKSAEATYGKWAFVSTNGAAGIGAKSTTDYNVAYNKDLIAFLPWVRKDVCLAINAKLGIPANGGKPPQENSSFNIESPFTGGFVDGGSALEMTGGLLDGKHAACFEGNAGSGNKLPGTYFFYQIMIAR